jgi:hypothetical protein
MTLNGESNARIIVFDGICCLCSGWARFLGRHRIDPPFRLIRMQRRRWAASGNWPTWLALCRDAGGMRFIGCSLEIATDGSDVVAPSATHRKVAMFVAQWPDARRERP